MTIFRSVLLATAALALPATPALADNHGAKPAVEAKKDAAQTEREKLFALFAESDERNR